MNDTITAISTPVGEGGIGIVRISGSKAIKIADKLFVSKNGGLRPSDFPSHTLHYGDIVNKKAKGEKIDEVLLTVMKAPRTYTKEDIVEINAHGGIVCLRRILELVLSYGARLAQPGEFTQRAFLNGRIDLSQAEAVLDIINSKTEASLRAAQMQLKGELSRKVKKIRSQLLDAQAHLEAAIDFPEDELEILGQGAIAKRIDNAIDKLKELLADYDNGRLLREGLTVVICGKANVGKSTLMNRLLKQKRVIVTPIPGTTRDAIEEIINLKGIPLRIVDTAGFIRTKDRLAREGVKKTLAYLNSADIFLLMLDLSDNLSREDITIINKIKNKKMLVVLNKMDLPERLKIDEVKRHMSDEKIVKISALKEKGLKELEQAICDMIWTGSVSSSHQPVVTNVRHARAIKKASSHLKVVRKNLYPDPTRRSEVYDKGKEFLALDLKDAINNLGSITGETFDVDLLDRIFSQFCIGK